MAKSKSNSKLISAKYVKMFLGLLVGIVVGCVGTYLLNPSDAAKLTAGLAFYGSSDGSALTPHCQVLSSGTKLCWSNAGDPMWGKAVYKSSVKNPTGKLTCWAVTDPSTNLSALVAYPAMQATVMQGTPVFTQTFSPLAPSGTMFGVQTQASGSNAEWCQSLVLDSGSNVLGQGGFVLYAPGTTSIE